MTETGAVGPAETKGPTPGGKPQKPTGLAAKIAFVTAVLLALAGFIDAANSVFTKTQSFTCRFGVSLPWCAAEATIRTTADFLGEWKNKNKTSGAIRRISIDQLGWTNFSSVVGAHVSPLTATGGMPPHRLCLQIAAQFMLSGTRALRK